MLSLGVVLGYGDFGFALGLIQQERVGQHALITQECHSRIEKRTCVLAARTNPAAIGRMDCAGAIKNGVGTLSQRHFDLLHGCFYFAPCAYRLRSGRHRIRLRRLTRLARGRAARCGQFLFARQRLFAALCGNEKTLGNRRQRHSVLLVVRCASSYDKQHVQSTNGANQALTTTAIPMSPFSIYPIGGSNQSKSPPTENVVQSGLDCVTFLLNSLLPD